MTASDLYQNLLVNLKNIPGWRIGRKIIVIESDDWGSIRMPSLETYRKLKKAGLDMDSGTLYRYNLNDTIESPEDLLSLFEILDSSGARYGNIPVITAVSVVANPDFDNIRANGFQHYKYELFTDTYIKYYGTLKGFELIREGIEKRIFVPQFHGREHLNVPVWMGALINNDEQTHIAFSEGFWGFRNKHPQKIRYQAAFDLEIISQVSVQKEIIIDGLQLFEKIFGFKATLFVPPNGPLHNELEKTVAGYGIEGISSAKCHTMPLGSGEYKKYFRYLGQVNSSKQLYLTRNCMFEPGIKGKDWVSSCMKEIEAAFKWRKPAIISSHRVNYIGSLNPANRDYGLNQLKSLLLKINNKWPDREYMTSGELINLIKESRKSS